MAEDTHADDDPTGLGGSRDPLDAQTLDERLARSRAIRLLTQASVAKVLGVSRAAVSQWETGVSRPETHRLVELAHLYGMSVDWLITGEMKYAYEINEDEERERNRFEANQALRWRVPLRDVHQVKEWHAMPEEYRKKLPWDMLADRSIGEITVDDINSPSPVDCFAMEMPNNSMSPEYQAGDMVIFWGIFDRDIRPGAIVLVAPDKHLEPVLRLYRPIHMDQNGTVTSFSLIALNEDWPTIKVTDPIKATFLASPVEMKRLLAHHL